MFTASGEARDSLFTAAEKLTSKGQKKRFSFFSNFFNYFWSDSSTEKQIAVANASEKSKAGNQLEYARNQFAQFFDVRFTKNLFLYKQNNLFFCYMTRYAMSNPKWFKGTLS